MLSSSPSPPFFFIWNKEITIFTTRFYAKDEVVQLLDHGLVKLSRPLSNGPDVAEEYFAGNGGHIVRVNEFVNDHVAIQLI